ncbi:MAG: galactokinase family protein [Promethearchaeia archaeon]
MITVDEWLGTKKGTDRLRKHLFRVYGKDYKNVKDKLIFIQSLLRLHRKTYGNLPTLIIRVPGRSNLMGRHIDHQYGMLNLVAIDKEIIFVASPQNLPEIHVQNENAQKFPSMQFSTQIGQKFLQLPWKHIIENQDLLNTFRETPGSWVNYLKGAYYKTGHHFKKKSLKGANITVGGTIPLAAGLSSSSAITLGMIKVLLELNKFNISQKNLISLARDAEWFVGTRGGNGDHAALLYAEKDKIIQYSPREKQILNRGHFPNDYVLIVCVSHIPAEKSGKKRDIFNSRVLAYQVGLLLFKEQFPRLEEKIKQIDDLRPANLDIADGELLEMLLSIPHSVEYSKLPQILEKYWERLMKRFHFADPPQHLKIRDVLIYGIAECKRSIRFLKLILKHKLKSAGELMNISHNGDRVIKFNKHMEPCNYKISYSQAYVRKLLTTAKMEKEQLQFEYLPGRYRCSIKEIDYLVDICTQSEGVLGAQISGGGLGGSCMALVHKDYSTTVRKSIERQYREHFHQNCRTYECIPVDGVSLF